MFIRETLVGGHTPPFKHLPAKAGETYTVGEALVLADDGAVTKCAATAVPRYICQGPAAENGTVPCEPVIPGVSYTVPLSAAGGALKVGNKVTLSAAALEVTATTASGVAEIVRLDGTAVGDTVLVRF